MTASLRSYAAVLRPLNWSLHLHIPLSDLPKIHATIPTLGIDVVLDHLASPDPATDPRDQLGYAQLMDLLARKLVWVKLSGLYRFSEMPGLGEFVREVLRVAPGQVVWASDWPHTGGAGRNPGGDRRRVQEFRRVDVGGFLEECWGWCGGKEGGDEGMRRVLVENPRRLWGWEGKD